MDLRWYYGDDELARWRGREETVWKLEVGGLSTMDFCLTRLEL